MSHNSNIFTVRVPEDIKQKLPGVAADNGMTTPEFIRAVLRLIVDGKFSLALVFQQDKQNGQAYPIRLPITVNGKEVFGSLQFLLEEETEGATERWPCPKIP